MQHDIPVDTIGPHGAAMADAVQKCVHCGFCLPACPTYLALGQEMDSPRGRIFLMKEVLESQVSLDEAAPYLDRCLGCVGCVTACPSGVPYGHLITAFRGRAESQRRRPLADRLLRWFVLSTLPYPGRFRWALRMGVWSRPFARWLPRRMRDMLALLPRRLPSSAPLPPLVPAEGKRRARVALLAGCAQQVLAPEINWATVRVLARNGVEVLIPAAQTCCGALAAHTGKLDLAQKFAVRNLPAFPTDVDAILTNAAGCGSGLHEYGLWLQGTPHAAAAEAFVKKVQDVSQFLAQLGLASTPALPGPVTVAYHDACHLAHAQKVRLAPRQLLTSIDGLRLVEIPSGDICCGSAGTYNLEQPEIARQLGREKAEAIRTTGAQVVATGNIGCLTQIATHLAALAAPLPVLHTMELLDRAYRGQSVSDRPL
jgi:glycolate oxidase iron-sulfur subunit